MAEGKIRLKSCRKITANAISAENVLSFREEHVHNMTPQFVPNVFQGVDVLERAKFRRLIIILDSDETLFDVNYFVASINIVIGTTIVAEFYIADGTGDYETWTYITDKSWVEHKKIGRVEDGAKRNTFEYHIIMYGTKVIAEVNV